MATTVDDTLAELWFRHDCILISGAGASPYGDDDGVSIPIRGFIRQTTRTILGVGGEERSVDTTLRLPIAILHDATPVTVAVGDQVELPAPFNGKWEVAEVTINHGAGQSTPDHQRLTLKAMS